MSRIQVRKWVFSPIRKRVGVYDTDELPSMIDITYKIKGAEDPYTATIEMEDGKYSADTAVLSTRRSSSKLTAVVTSVETY